MPLWNNNLTLKPVLLSSGQLPNWHFALCSRTEPEYSFFFFFNLVSAGSYLHNKAQHLALTAFLAAFPQPFRGEELLFLGDPEHMWKVKLTIQTFSSRWAGYPGGQVSLKVENEINTCCLPTPLPCSLGLRWRCFPDSKWLHARVSCFNTLVPSVTPSLIDMLTYTFILLFIYFSPYFLALSFVDCPLHVQIWIWWCKQEWDTISSSKILTKQRQK